MGKVDLYESELADALLSAGSPRSVTDLFAAGHGAPPTVVRDLLNRMGRPIHGRARRGTAYPTTPELHPLLYEWYFTKETAVFVSTVARGSGDTWVFLGVPSVAHEMSKVSEHVRLIDADAAVLDRFDGLSERAEVTIAEVGDAPVARSAVAVIDPPWYPGDVVRWIDIACRHIQPGGAIVSTLFPALTRPSAGREREAIFAMAERLGRVELRSSRLEYSTPLFERESLRAAGIPDPGDWRRADLLVIRDVNPGLAPPEMDGVDAAPTVHLGVEGWDRFVLGEQVVFLSQTATILDDDQGPIHPIPGCVGAVLPSVSERDPLRQHVGLWTSRNRVAAVSDPVLVHRWLTRLQADGLDTIASNGWRHWDAPLRGDLTAAGQDEQLRFLLGVLHVENTP